MPEAPTQPTLNLHLQQLAYLREVSRRDTWAAAATALNVSQPALSQALSEVERRMGVEIFEKDGRRRRFTSDGLEVLAYAREVLGRTQELQRQLRRRSEGAAGRLRLGMIDAGSLYLLPRAVAVFRERHPEVQLELAVAASADLERRLRRFELDMAFVIGDAGAAGDVDRELFEEEELWIYAPSGSRGDGSTSDWVLYPRESHTRACIDEGLEARGIRPRVVLESGNPQVLRQMVALNLGWSVLPRAVAESDQAALRRPRGGALATRSLCVARRRHRPADPRAEAFVALARELR
jgi:DNA-binding transcriptional LysR family regulator